MSIPRSKDMPEAMNPHHKYRLQDVMKDAVFGVKSNLGLPLQDGRASVPLCPLCGEQCAIRQVKQGEQCDILSVIPASPSRGTTQAGNSNRQEARVVTIHVLGLWALGCHSHFLSLGSQNYFAFLNADQSIQKLVSKWPPFGFKYDFRNFWYFGYLIKQLRFVTGKMIKDFINLIQQVKLVMTQLLVASLSCKISRQILSNN